MATCAITSTAKGIKLVFSDGSARLFSSPVITAAPTAAGLAYPDGRTNLIEFRQGETYFLLPIADITTVGGVTKAGTLAGVFDQIMILLQLASAPARNWLKPNGVLAESYARDTGTGSQNVLTSGRQSFVAVYLNAGEVVTSITFTSGSSTGASGATNIWFSLYSAAAAKLAVTADDAASGWAVGVRKTLALATPYTVPTSGIYYVGVMVAATTVNQLLGISQNTNIALLPPIVAGIDNTNTGLTTPATAPATAVFTANGLMPYVTIQ